jgi:hypothetical protein
MGQDFDFSTGAQSDAGDTEPVGSGGDPYGGGDWDMGNIETLPTGANPGQDSYSPVGPQGFDWGDTIQGIGQATATVMGTATQARGLIGPNGYLYDNTPALPNLGVSPMPVPGGTNSGTLGTAGAIVRYARNMTGLRVTARSIVGLIVRYGFPAAAALTKLDMRSLLTLFMREKGVRHHRRGPGLYTVARKLRAADRLRHTVARILGRGGYTHRARARRPYRALGRRRRR